MNIPARFNLPPITRGIGLAFVTLTCLHAYLRVLGGSGDGADAAPTLSAGLPYLVLVPGLSWYLPWTPLTAALINRDPINLAVSALVLTLAGRYFERAWGSAEYTKFMLIIAIGPNVLCASMLATAYIVTGSQDALYATINGTAAFQAAFLVAFKQLIPEHTVDLFKSAVRIRVKHFPALFVVSYTALSPLTGAFSSTILVWLGFLVSWTYLRFYRLNPSTTLDHLDLEPSASTRGDASDTFAFSHFFPDAVQALIDPACESVYQLCLRTKMVPPLSSQVIAEGGLVTAQQAAERGTAGPLAGGSQKTLEAERRRALALKALDQKLSEASSSSKAVVASITPPATIPDTAASEVAAVQVQSGKANDYS